ncbi:tyrosine-protein phosphatase non-receptor type 21-like [Limulus polyphemus]|uniref:Tyrosine-protein phosphatase non-receptor type 21-like n=1 Tax=Limulus polyphemus TaxID=6850 RepID=A0ABM1RUF4_LIMPO|nr:tyrosine-protein phosphatase non-receptor type 21-like [Limulus polyphemus]
MFLNNQILLGFHIIRNYSVSSATYITCSLVIKHAPSRTQRPVWHIQYTDWPDHGCPLNLQGFINFMEQIDSVRRLALNEQPPERSRNSPTLIHCSAGVGRTGVVMLCDILFYSLDHNETVDIPKVLTQLRLQRMLTVQTLAQYKFVYAILIQYLKNSRLI